MVLGLPPVCTRLVLYQHWLPSLLLLLLHRPDLLGPQGWPPMLQSPVSWLQSGKPGFRCLFHAINCVTLGELVSLSEPQFPCGAKEAGGLEGFSGGPVVMTTPSAGGRVPSLGQGLDPTGRN